MFLSEFDSLFIVLEFLNNLVVLSLESIVLFVHHGDSFVIIDFVMSHGTAL